MVDAVGIKPVARDISVTRIGATAPVAAVQASSTSATKTPTGVAALSGIAKALSAAPPVDTERVAKIRKAIQDGKFPILPATIADRLIALKMQWNPNEAA